MEKIKHYKIIDKWWKNELFEGITEKEIGKGPLVSKRYIVEYDTIEEQLEDFLIKNKNKDKVYCYMESEKEKIIVKDSIIKIIIPILLAFIGTIATLIYKFIDLIVMKDWNFTYKFGLIYIIYYFIGFIFLIIINMFVNVFYEKTAKESSYKFVLNKLKN